MDKRRTQHDLIAAALLATVIIAIIIGAVFDFSPTVQWAGLIVSFVLSAVLLLAYWLSPPDDDG